MFKRFQQREYQLLAHLLNGATARTNYEAYAGKLIPRSEVLDPKITAALGSGATADMICRLMARNCSKGVRASALPRNISPSFPRPYHATDTSKGVKN